MIKRVFIFALAALFPAWAHAQAVNWGDYQDSNQTIYLYFSTTGTDGVAETLTSGAVDIYEDGSTTQITTAETLTASFDSVTGYNQLAVDLNDSGFETGKTYTCILTAGTVDSVSVAGKVVGVFSVGRYASVTATGGVVQANVVQLSGDSTAADNSESFFDGTGYAGTGNTIPTVTTVTNSSTPQTTIFVDDGGNDSNSGLTQAAPKLTISAAMTAAGAGGKVIVLPGTYSGAVTVSLDGLTLEGIDPVTCIITHNSGDTLTVTGDNVTLRGLTCTASAATSNGTGATATSVKNLTIDRCVFNGHFDGLRLITCDQLIIDRTVANGTFDGLNPSGCTGTISNSTFTTDGTWATDTQFRACYINDVQASLDDMLTNLTFNTCKFIARKAGVGASNTEIVGIIATGTVTLNGCMVIAEATNASNTGGVWAVRNEGKLIIQYTYPGRLTINGGMLYATTAGSGTVYKIINTNSASEARVIGLAYTASEVSGKVYNDTAQAIASGGITSASFAADAIGATAIAADSIGASEIASDAIGANEIATDAIGANEIAANAIGSSEIASDAIAAGEIADDAINAAAIATDAIAKIADGVWDELLSGHTTTGTTGLRLSRIPDVAAGSAGGMFIAGTNAATTVNITGNVTGNLSGSIGSVGANGITASSIASAAIGNDEIATDAISAAEIADNAIDANTIQTNAIGASQVASDAIVEIQSGLALENSVDNVPTVAELNARTLATASYATAGQINDIETELLNVPTNAEFASGLDALPTAAENADAVFDEAMAGHTSIGTFGATASNTLTAANAAQSAAEDAVTNIEALPSSADIVTTLLNATLSDTGANKVGRALYYTVQSYESAGVFTEAALSGAAFPLTGTGLSNFNTFFNNGNAASTKTINNVTAPKNVTINVPQ